MKYIVVAAASAAVVAGTVWWCSSGYDAWLGRRADRNIAALAGDDGLVSFKDAYNPGDSLLTTSFADLARGGWPGGDIVRMQDELFTSRSSLSTIHLRPGDFNWAKLDWHENHGTTTVVDARGGYRVFAPGTGRREILRALATADSVSSNMEFDEYGRVVPEKTWMRVYAREKDRWWGTSPYPPNDR